ncbi:subtilase family protein [Sarocladium implicatum]|nr:subtilase family protein [Sarocladium implicatum]
MHAAALLALLPMAMAAPQAQAPAKRDSPAPLIVPRGVELIEGKYIVKMKSDSVTAAVSSAISKIASVADYTYSRKFNGFAGSLSDKEVQSLRDDPNVEYVEQNAKVWMFATQQNAPWGLARISSQAPGGTTYTYDESAGEGTCAYVVDTGIDVDHPDFEGRATFAKNFADSNDNDGQGHGTHVAGTIGSTTYGVAKKTKLFAVKVLNDDGQGSNADVIAGLDFVVDDAPTQDCPNGVVVNMSLGGYFSSSVNQAAASITSAGHFLAVAAGNDGADSADYSPASESSACTVGATEKDDSLATYSNIGSLVDVLAPGSDILSTWIGGETNTISGTSMASPHVAGLAAYLLGTGESADGLCEAIASSGLDGVISGVPSDTVNKLINNGEGNNSTARRH